MAKRKKEIEVKTLSCGLYAKWSNRCKELPQFLKFTNTIPLRFESEFGFTLQIKKAKGKTLQYTVHHPPFLNDKGDITPSFVGEIPISSNDFKTYVGDTLWEPLSDKVGQWRVIAAISGTVYEDKTFQIVSDTSLYQQLIDENCHNHI